jgi:hypothetical protein
MPVTSASSPFNRMMSRAWAKPLADKVARSRSRPNWRAQNPDRPGQLRPAGAGPLGQLAQQLLIGRRQLRPGLIPSSVTSVI